VNPAGIDARSPVVALYLGAAVKSLQNRAIPAVSAWKEPFQTGQNISIEKTYKIHTSVCEWIYTGAEPVQQDGKSG
jgi:hypothetical protein